MSDDSKFGWHFTGDTLRDGSPIPPINEWIEFDGPIVPCQSGLHMSEHPMDALEHAPGVMLHRVELAGEMVSHGDPVDKWAGSRRRIVASIDATSILRDFARWCAISVMDNWDAPEVVRQYLTTGDESLRDAAWGAAMDAARYAARDAAWYAAWYAARDAAWDAAREAAWYAAREKQRDEFAIRVSNAFLGEAL